MLRDIIAVHREEIIRRACAKVASRPAPAATTHELTNGVPLFLTQLNRTLEQEASQVVADGVEMGESATQHGGDLFDQGFTIAQVVHAYGDICQAITELALERRLSFGTNDFHTLNRCLDDAIASAVTEFARQRDADVSDAQVREHGALAHELRNHLNVATLALEAVESGSVGVAGSTMQVLDRSLRELRELIDRLASEVRIVSARHSTERLRLADFIEAMRVHATPDATSRGIEFTVAPVDEALMVDVDRRQFGAAVSNLLLNAFKFTRPRGRVALRTRSTADRVSIEVEDACGGLPPGAGEAVLRAFEQQGSDRAAGGSGLTISRRAIEAEGGTLSLRDIPGKGCVFSAEIPLAASVT